MSDRVVEQLRRVVSRHFLPRRHRALLSVFAVRPPYRRWNLPQLLVTIFLGVVE
jgi:hypothetical protein